MGIVSGLLTLFAPALHCIRAASGQFLTTATTQRSAAKDMQDALYAGRRRAVN